MNTLTEGKTKEMTVYKNLKKGSYRLPLIHLNSTTQVIQRTIRVATARYYPEGSSSIKKNFDTRTAWIEVGLHSIT